MVTMTRTNTLILTAVTAALYAWMGVAFADNYFTATLFNGGAWADSSALSWLLLILIVAAGVFEATKIPAGGVTIDAAADTGGGRVSDPRLWRPLLGKTYLAVLWMPLSFFVGALLNVDFLLAGTVSANPVLFGITVFLVLGWKVAGFVELDRFLIPALGTLWQAGHPIHRHAGEQPTEHRPSFST